MPWVEDIADGCRLHIRVTPRSSRNKVDGLMGEALKIRLCAPPVEGKANAVLVEFLADQLGVPRRTLTLLSGEQARTKCIHVAGLSARAVTERLRGPQPC